MGFPYSAQTVLITGASSGIGLEFARAFAARGASLVLVARRQDRLEQLASELRHDHGVTVDVVASDLSSANAAAALRARVGELGLTVTSLINNAGFGTFGPFLDEDPELLTQEIAVDVLTPVQLTAAFLPDLLAAGNGLLINVASMAAYTPTPRMAVYGAAKAFVLSFTESLWAELQGTGVTVFALSPGATSTEFNAVVGTDDATAGATPPPHPGQRGCHCIASPRIETPWSQCHRRQREPFCGRYSSAGQPPQDGDDDAPTDRSSQTPTGLINYLRREPARFASVDQVSRESMPRISEPLSRAAEPWKPRLVD